MKFDLKYPDKVDPKQVYPNKLMGPHPEIWVTENLGQTWYRRPCVVCRTLTGWRTVGEGYSSPICSDECLEQFT